MKSLYQKVGMADVDLIYGPKMVSTWGDHSYVESTDIYLEFTDHQGDNSVLHMMCSIKISSNAIPFFNA